ncbi:MAG: cupin domain-containing protein [Betaproteobacteria bacterium]|nr:cupin domain-containing protein [Betaproteobacteria bacterium]
MPIQRLAGLPVDEFLRRHWQKRPLLARSALPQYAGLVDRDTLFELAARDDLESRVVLRGGRRWRVRHGPFSPRELARLPRRGWTLLVQGVNHALPAAQDLLLEFAFIPYARLDDLMVSYAPAGGGVGPHFDSYDVFLLQGQGARRWRTSRQRDLAQVPGAPLRLLRRFRATGEWVLRPGDMLYLPPRCAHDGVALGESVTYSVGFRAPSAQELGSRFLEHLQDHLQLDGMYEDPDLRRLRHPAQLDHRMVRKAERLLRDVRWTGADTARFLGGYLTEPKAHVFFSRPSRTLAPRAFAARAARHGLRLALRTRMLFRGDTIFMNGEAHTVGAPAARLLARLADRRRLPPLALSGGESARLLYEWYRAGYIEFGER